MARPTAVTGSLPLVTVLLAAVLALAGCGADATIVETEASLSLIVTSDPPVAATIDGGRVHLEGPTPRMVTLQPGETRTIDGLQPGNYRVSVEALSGGDVARYGETTVTVVAGENRQATVQLRDFFSHSVTVPNEWAVGQPMAVQFGTVQNADGYRVEWAGNAGFSGAQSVVVSGPPATVTPQAEGNLYVRVRARTRFGSNSVPTAGQPVSVVDACARLRTTVSLGQSRNGTLEPGRSCRDGGRFFDFIGLTIGQMTLFNVNMTATGFGPFVGAFEDGGFSTTDSQISGRSRAESPVAAEHILPAGTYWLFASAGVADSQSPATGSYSVSLQGRTEAQVGCMDETFVTHTSITLTDARLTGSDCTTTYTDSPSVTRYYDGYAFLLFPGETVRARVVANFPVDFTYFTEGTFRDGEFDIPPLEVTSVEASTDELLFHYFYVISSQHQGTGAYAVDFELIGSAEGEAALQARGAQVRLFHERAGSGMPRGGLVQVDRGLVEASGVEKGIRVMVPSEPLTPPARSASGAWDAPLATSAPPAPAAGGSRLSDLLRARSHM